MTQRRDAIENTLSLHRACPEGVVWARKFETWEDLWRAIKAPDWMLWALEEFGYRDERSLRTFAARCAARSQSLWPDPHASRALGAATRTAEGSLSPEALRAEFTAARKRASAIVSRPDYCEAMAAAACAITGALEERPYEAAKTASRESARAIAWDLAQPGSWPEEAGWQSALLRELVGSDVHACIAEIRAKNRGTLHVL